MKNNIGNTLKFIVPAEKRITLTVGKINGLTIKINEAAATPITSGTDKDHLGVSYYESHSEQSVIITETSDAYNIIRSIVITNYGVPTGIDNTADEIKAVKFVENGQLFIRRGEKVYTITGEEVK